jgi:8-oxo-dGTP pyrophosphatase MutT (NUDIX family)
MPSINRHGSGAEDAEEPVGNHPGAGDGAPTAEGHLSADESLVELRCSVVVSRGHVLLLLLLRRRRSAVDEWVLPGGRPRPGEGMFACARREVAEETGVQIIPERCAFVADVIGPGGARRQVELVLTARVTGAEDAKLVGEEGVEPRWVPVAEVRALNLKPAVAGFLPDVVNGRAQTAPYLGNLWRSEAHGDASDSDQDLWSGEWSGERTAEGRG